jgi:hypothetical protein
VLLRPGLNTIIDHDHELFWSWCGELFAGTKATYFMDSEREVKELFGLACRTALAGISAPGRAGWEEQRDRITQMEPNLRDLVTRKHVVLVYLTLPLLEAILRKTCSQFVAFDGEVRSAFHPRSRSDPYRVGQRCSSMRDLLWLIYDDVAGAEVREGLDFVRRHLSELEPGKDPFDVLFRWRNSSLHGETSLPTVGGTVFNFAILVALDAIAAEYEALRDQIMEQVRWEAQTASSDFRSPWSYYPPYW